MEQGTGACLLAAVTLPPDPPLVQERQTRAFGSHARALSEWDRHIFRNRRTLSTLEAEMKRVAGAQDALERQLSILEVHQAEIHSALEGMHREAEQLYEKEGPRSDDASRERDALFAVAEDVSQQLNHIGLSLRDTISIVNSQAAAADPAADPLSAAVAIINNQLCSLVWIDEQAQGLRARVLALEH